MKNRIIFLIGIILLLYVKGYGQSISPITLNFEELSQLKEEDTNVKKIADAKRELVKRSNQILTNRKTYSVTYNGASLPGISKNNFISYHGYMWPNPKTKNGLPYILKDGKRNPYNEKISDRPMLEGLNRDIFQLGLAYFYTNDEKYVLWATTLLNCFFVDPKTRMEPNFNFSQVTPGKNETGGSIMEAVMFIEVLEGIQLMKSSPNFSQELSRNLNSWFGDFLGWIEESPKGKINALHKNNRGTYYTLLRCDIAMFLNDRKRATRIFKNEAYQRVIDQISNQGEMKDELRRATPLGYLKYNLKAFNELDEIGKKLGFDLFNYNGPKGESLKKAFEWLDRYKTGKLVWNYSSEGGITTPRRAMMKNEDENSVRFSVERFDNYLEILTSRSK
ncbi:alginate lyase family protein [Sphingobacterium sp. 18053]|uniref:alginate lyase family protein n=1 Tax=Sphingobacterium sp. 18053 TaxID=2681401 RepID=UPI00135CDCDE|nr:alginate lyase family protein [Sphingobacterium sp. 18053]